MRKGLKEKLNARWFWLARWFCRVFCMLFFRLHFLGLKNIPKKGAFILVCNHQSYLDPVFCGIPLKRHLFFLARDTLFNNWFFGRLLASVNSIPVRRGQADLTAFKKVIAKLNDGNALCLFPEGTRTTDGKIAPFKAGLGLLCRRSAPYVLPVVVDGPFEAWPRHKKIFSPGTIVVSYGKALSPEQIKNMNDSELTERLTRSLRQMQNDCRIMQGKKPYEY
jgi:1-acyl-sn-glycerol-3-phosphate acyltransferase